jgi:hypothetical protein
MLIFFPFDFLQKKQSQKSDFISDHTTRQKYLPLYFYIGQPRRADRL